jgi:hypothetical protein
VSEWSEYVSTSPLKPEGTRSNKACALACIGDALRHLDEGDEADALYLIREAAVLLRAWRKSLPAESRGDRIPSSEVELAWGKSDDRKLLTAAAQKVVSGLGWLEGTDSEGRSVRLAEAHLRFLGKRLLRRGVNL